MIPAISQVCSLASSFEEDLAQFDLPGVEVWLTKLEAHVHEHGLEATARIVEAYPGKLVAAAYQGGLWQNPSAARDEAWQLFRSRLELCRAIGIPVVIVAADMAGKPSIELVRSWQDDLRRAGDLASEYGIRLAIEFQARATVGNNLLSLAAILAPLEHDSLGICLDSFHFFTGPSQSEDLARCPAELLFHVQLSDLLAQPRELASDSDRILPGDGDIPLSPIVEHLRRTDYQGAVSVETLDPLIGQSPPAQLGDAVRAALERLGVEE